MPAGKSKDEVESLVERDQRLLDAMMDAVRDYIENLPKEVIQHDEHGGIIGRRPIQFQGTEFIVGTRLGAFAISIYPAPYSRGAEEAR
jgi:hypothetical protein